MVANSPRQVLQQACALGWINDETTWLNMMKDSNATSHTYNQKLALEIYQQLPDYFKAIEQSVNFLCQRFPVKQGYAMLNFL